MKKNDNCVDRIASSWKISKQLMQHHYFKYASYVILDRAIPNVVDGLKACAKAHFAYSLADA